MSNETTARVSDDIMVRLPSPIPMNIPKVSGELKACNGYAIVHLSKLSESGLRDHVASGDPRNLVVFCDALTGEHAGRSVVVGTSTLSVAPCSGNGSYYIKSTDIVGWSDDG